MATANYFFTCAYVIDATCSDKCFLFHVITGRRYFFFNFVVTLRFFLTILLSFSLRQVFWKTSIFYLHNNSAVLILMLSSKIMLSYTILIQTWETFAGFFYDKVFYTLYFMTVPHFFLWMSFFFEKLKTSLKSYFYINCRTFVNRFLFIKVEFLIKVRTKLHIKIT